jgi:hypothetical protein
MRVVKKMTLIQLLNKTGQGKDEELALMQTNNIKGIIFGYPSMWTMDNTHICVEKGALHIFNDTKLDIFDIINGKYKPNNNGQTPDALRYMFEVHKLNDDIYLPATQTVIYPYTVGRLKNNLYIEGMMMLTELDNMYTRHKKQQHDNFEDIKHR